MVEAFAFWSSFLSEQDKKEFFGQMMSNICGSKGWIVTLGAILDSWANFDLSLYSDKIIDVVAESDCYEYRRIILVRLSHCPPLTSVNSVRDLQTALIQVQINGKLLDHDLNSVLHFRSEDTSLDFVKYRILESLSEKDTVVEEFCMNEIEAKVPAMTRLYADFNILFNLAPAKESLLRIGLQALIENKARASKMQYYEASKSWLNLLASTLDKDFSVELLKQFVDLTREFLIPLAFQHVYSYLKRNESDSRLVPLFLHLVSVKGCELDEDFILSCSQAVSLSRIILEKNRIIFRKPVVANSMKHKQLIAQWELMLQLVPILDMENPAEFLKKVSHCVQQSCTLVSIQFFQIWFMFKWIQRHSCFEDFLDLVPLHHAKCNVSCSNLQIILYQILYGNRVPIRRVN